MVVRGYAQAVTTYATTDADYAGKVQIARQASRRALGAIRAGLPNLPPKERKAYDDWLRDAERPADGRQ